MRYRRYKKRRSNVVKMTFQSFVDISTQADNMQIISVNAGGKNVLRRLAPFFAAYKYYKLGGVSIKLIPASTLPVDPTGLSIDESDFQTVDPRDQLTPGMCRITNGEDILENITGLSGDKQRELYENMLLDPRWFKWMLQTGVKRYGKPRYWQIGQLHQDKWPGSQFNMAQFNNINAIVGTEYQSVAFNNVQGNKVTQTNGSTPYGIFQTGHRGVLGWMPTDGLQRVFNGTSFVEEPLIASPPEVELFKILTPPMHKTNYWYRCFITETVFFKEPVLMNVNGFRPIDVFRRSPIVGGSLPTQEISYDTDEAINIKTGGNDGSN